MKIIRMTLLVGLVVVFISLFYDIGLSHAQSVLLKTEAGGEYQALSARICPLMADLVIEKKKKESDVAKSIVANLKPSDDGYYCLVTAGTDGMHIGIDFISGTMNIGIGLIHDVKELGRRLVFSKGHLKCEEKTFIFDEGAYIVARDNKLYGWGIKVKALRTMSMEKKTVEFYAPQTGGSQSQSLGKPETEQYHGLVSERVKIEEGIITQQKLFEFLRTANYQRPFIDFDKKYVLIFGPRKGPMLAQSQKVEINAVALEKAKIGVVVRTEFCSAWPDDDGMIPFVLVLVPKSVVEME